MGGAGLTLWSPPRHLVCRPAPLAAPVTETLLAVETEAMAEYAATLQAALEEVRAAVCCCMSPWHTPCCPPEGVDGETSPLLAPVAPLQLRARNDALEEEVARMDARTVGVKASLEKRISVIGAVRAAAGAAAVVAVEAAAAARGTGCLQRDNVSQGAGVDPPSAAHACVLPYPSSPCA